MDSTGFRATLENYTIVLSGDMTGTYEQHKELEGVLRSVDNPHKTWVIDADAVSLAPEGVTLWINIAHNFLRDYTLKYMPSHLATVLQYDPRYYHNKSVFEEAEILNPRTMPYSGLMQRRF